MGKSAKSEKNETGLPGFVEIEVSGNHYAWCIDGRPDYNSENGPQMPGGSIFPIILSALYTRESFTQEFIDETVQKLKANGVTPGVHVGEHSHGEASDCGFADRLQDILTKAQKESSKIQERFLALRKQGTITDEIIDAINYAYTFINRYNPGDIALRGTSLIRTMERDGAHVEHVQGDHQEQVAFVNMKSGITLDTNAINNQGSQAFNFDIWVAQERAQMLNINDEKFVTGASLILYMATEMVLVEDKGKNPVPIVIHQ